MDRNARREEIRWEGEREREGEWKERERSVGGRREREVWVGVPSVSIDLDECIFTDLYLPLFTTCTTPNHHLYT
jgi:hypothetical protein